MRIGITYDLRVESPLLSPSFERGGQGGLSLSLKEGGTGGVAVCRALPDDFQEEFDTPATIDAVAAVLSSLGHGVDKLGNGRELIERLLVSAPDFVFNIAEGQGISRSREARVPALLEMLGIPYSGSDPLTLAVTLDKTCAKRLVQSAAVAVPRSFTVEDRRSRMGNRRNLKDDLLSLIDFFPVIVKPAWEGSSKGIGRHCLIDRPDDLLQVVESICDRHRQPILVEEYIEGDELTVGIVGNQAPTIVGVMRILPQQRADRFIYCLDVKRDYLNRVQYETPPRLPTEIIRRITSAALLVFEVLGCRDVARIDFRVRDGIPYFLEVNPLPGLNPESSDLVIMARLNDWSYARLIETILQAGLSRQA